MKKRIICVVMFALFSVLFVGSPNVFAQEASLEETMAWLKSTVNSEGEIVILHYTDDGDYVGKTVRLTEISKIEKCSIYRKFSETFTAAGEKEKPATASESELALNFLSPDLFSVKEIDWSNSSTRLKGDSPFYSVSFSFKKRGIAERVEKALRHATKLCGGKSEPF